MVLSYNQRAKQAAQAIVSSGVMNAGFPTRAQVMAKRGDVGFPRMGRTSSGNARVRRIQAMANARTQAMARARAQANARAKAGGQFRATRSPGGRYTVSRTGSFARTGASASY